MKNKYLTISAIIIFGISAIFIASCSKTTDDTIVSHATVEKFMPDKAGVPSLLSGFIHQYSGHQSGIKSGNQSVELGEALWMLEGGVNYEYRGDKSELREFVKDEFTLTGSVFVDGNNVYHIYSDDLFDIFGELLQIADNFIDEQQALLFADLELLTLEGNTVELKYMVMAGSEGPEQIGMDETDYWYAAYGLGKCGPYHGTHGGKDATDRIQYFLNLINDSNINYWTSIETFENIDNESISCYGGSNCFWGFGLPGTCLNPFAMTHWLNNAYYVVDAYCPTGKQLINSKFTFRDDSEHPLPEFEHFFENITYGVPHVYVDPDDPPPGD